MRTGLVPAAISYAVTAPAQAQTYRERFSDWHMGEWGWGHMVAGGFGMLLFWVVVIGFAVVLVRALSQRAGDHTPRQMALDVLEERYARGEIDRQEFEERRQTLQRRR